MSWYDSSLITEEVGLRLPGIAREFNPPVCSQMHTIAVCGVQESFEVSLTNW